MQGGASHGLALTSFMVTRTQLHFFPSILADPERSCCLVIGGFGFTPHRDRHVHRNHMVRVVCLVGVYG
jgi:hypothetical protein